MIGYYDYTVILTYLSLISAISGLFALLKGDLDFRFALLCLAISGLLDCFDGVVARSKLNRSLEEKKNGIEIDSLTDLIAFGILPASIMMKLNRSLCAYLVAIFYTLTAMIRLAYYNVSEDLRQAQTDQCRQYYEGLPVTFSAITFPLVFLFFKAKPEAYLFACLLMAVLFIAPIKIKKIHIHLWK